MSEIKGQLLGIVLVLTIFGIVAIAMSNAFETSADTIQERIENIAYEGTSKPAGRVHTDYSLHY